MCLILSNNEVRRNLAVQELIGEMEAAFRSFHRGTMEVPQRVKIALPDGQGYCAFMPSYVPDGRALGIKVNTNFHGNPGKYGLPRILGVIVLLDVECGKPLAVMDSTVITAFRTAAASAVAIRYLAHSRAERLGILGAGALALPHIEACCEVRAITKVSVYSPTLASRREAFLAAARAAANVPVYFGSSPEEVVKSADILIVCTSSQVPVLDGHWIQPGTCVVAVGNAKPDTRELDTMTVVRSRIICDSLKACALEAGDLLLPLREGVINNSHVQLELGDVIGNPGLGRTDDAQIVLFKSVGLGFQDIVAASHVYRKALGSEDGLQVEFLTECAPQDSSKAG